MRTDFPDSILDLDLFDWFFPAAQRTGTGGLLPLANDKYLCVSKMALNILVFLWLSVPD